MIMTMKFLLSTVTVTMTYQPCLIAVTRTILSTVMLELKTMCMIILQLITLPSMRAHSMLNLGIKKKVFKMGHLNIQGIQNKVEQIDLMLNSSENDIHLLGINESKSLL